MEKSLYEIVYNHRYSFTLAFILCIGVSAVVYMALPRVYESESLIWMNASRSTEVDSDQAAIALARQDQFLASQARIMLSQDVVRAAVEAITPERLYPDNKSQPNST